MRRILLRMERKTLAVAHDGAGTILEAGKVHPGVVLLALTLADMGGAGVVRACGRAPPTSSAGSSPSRATAAARSRTTSTSSRPRHRGGHRAAPRAGPAWRTPVAGLASPHEPAAQITDDDHQLVGLDGLGRGAAWKPAVSACIRSAKRPRAVRAIAGIAPPSSGGSDRTRRTREWPSSPGISMSLTSTLGPNSRRRSNASGASPPW